MKLLLKISCCTLLLLLVGLPNSYAQKACCSKEQMAKCITPDKTSVANAAKACCVSTKKETTSGCKPSECRGAKTKFGEAKVISELRSELIALKSKMENHEVNFSNEAITVHAIVGENDDQSIEIIQSHLKIIESEVASLIVADVPVIEYSDKKAVRVKQLKDRITEVSSLL